MADKLISIVIAAYNAEEYIAKCLDSIILQTYSNWEAWICDDNSSDSTWNILMEYQKKDNRIHLLQNSENIFSGASRNRCFEKCNGDLIVIQDADDLATERRLQTLVNAISNINVDFVSSGYYLFDDSGIYKQIVPAIKAPVKKDFLFGIPFCHAATIFTAKCLKEAGGYRVGRETRRGQDYDLFMRLYALNYVGVNIDDILYGYRVDRNTISRRRFKFRIDECLIRYKGFRLLGLLPAGLPYLLKPIAAHFWQMIVKERRK